MSNIESPVEANPANAPQVAVTGPEAQDNLTATFERIDVDAPRVIDPTTLTPLVDPTEFVEQTGIHADLVGKVLIGRQVVGIIDRKSYMAREGVSPEVATIAINRVGNGSQHVVTNVGPGQDMFAILMGDLQSPTHAEQRSNTDYRPKLFLLKPGENLEIGRGEHNDIVLNDTLVSKGHAAVGLDENGMLVVSDNHSTNGTKLKVEVDPSRSTVSQDPSDYVDKHNEYNGENPPRYFQAGLAEAASAEHPHESQDASIVNQEQGLYAVFDGAGGAVNGAAAAQAAREAFAKALDGLSPKASAEDVQKAMLEAFDSADANVRNKADGGYTTGTAIKMHNDGQGRNFVTWGSVGDSRLYVYNSKTYELKQVSKDETLQQLLRAEEAKKTGRPVAENAYEDKARVISNALGAPGTGSYALRQVGTFELGPDERIMLCSDGVVGDQGSELLTVDEIRTPLHHATSPEQAAQMLVAVSRKIDDKTALVVG